MRRPTKEEFVAYARKRGMDVVRAADQWEAWKAGGWRDGRGWAIVRWKLKLITYERQGYGMFGDRKQRKGSQADEIRRRDRAIDEMERINREAEAQRRRKH